MHELVARSHDHTPFSSCDTCIVFTKIVDGQMDGLMEARVHRQSIMPPQQSGGSMKDIYMVILVIALRTLKDGNLIANLLPQHLHSY